MLWRRCINGMLLIKPFYAGDVKEVETSAVKPTEETATAKANITVGEDGIFCRYNLSNLAACRPQA
jgi:hypothetical protein